MDNLVLQAARNGTLREPVGIAPDGCVPLFFQVGTEVVLEYVTVFEYEFARARARLDADDRFDVDRMVAAVAAGTWTVNVDEFARMTQAEQRAVFEALPD
jgi:hypothetical protein